MWIAIAALASLAAVAPIASAQDHATMVMGFDQQRTSHHFRLYKDGGAIEVGVKDAHDAVDRDAIRAHLPHIAAMFADGNFDAPMLVHDNDHVPGIAVLAARKAQLAYHYVETSTGGRLDVVTTDPEALDALHAFLRYQIREHHTGDPERVTDRP
jgi:hypothetical protein